MAKDTCPFVSVKRIADASSFSSMVDYFKENSTLALLAVREEKNDILP